MHELSNTCLTYVQPVRIMFGVSSIVPNTNIDGNDLHDCVNKQDKHALARCGMQMSISADREKATHRLPLMSSLTCSYGNRYMQHPGGLGKHVLFHADFMAI